MAETGRLRSKSVKLLPPLKAGPPSGGPDLSTLLQFTGSAQSVYVATIGLTRSQASDFAIAISSSPLQASDVQSLARALAIHLDAGVTG
jgi:hypothetical protein